MSRFILCPLCNEYHWSDKICPSIYSVKHEDDLYEIRAYSFEVAAEKWALEYNQQSDYALLTDCENIIVSDGVEEKEFRVSAEESIEYFVNEVE